MDDATIIKALRVCGGSAGATCREACPLWADRQAGPTLQGCQTMLLAAADRIEALASELDKVAADRDAYKTRADALEFDLGQHPNCDTCVHCDHIAPGLQHLTGPACDWCEGEDDHLLWEWRGPCAENGGTNEQNAGDA